MSSETRSAAGVPGKGARLPDKGDTLATKPAIPEIIREAQTAFRLALPELWQQRPGQWVAYHGAEQIGFSTSKRSLYEVCFRRGLKRGEFVVRRIEPQIDEIHLGPRALEC
jgi:hypothetical protein